MNRGTIQTIDHLFNTLLEDNIGSGSEIIQHGEVVYSRYAGYANREHKTPVHRDTVFPLSSMSKAFTAMIIMQLGESRKLAYDDRLRKFLPEFPAYADEIRISDLLYHTSGLLDPYRHYLQHDLNWYGLANQEIWNLLIEQTSLCFPVGSKHEYCNANYVLLAMIAETICQQSFRHIIHEGIFQPLGMVHSELADSRYVIDCRAYGYIKQEGQYLTIDSPWLSYGDGGVLSSLRDMFLWDQALYTDQLVRQSTLCQAFLPGTMSDGLSTGYGYGWNLPEYGNYHILTHAGGDPGFGSIIGRLPALKCSVILWANINNSWQTLNDILWSIIPLVVDET
ncbi:MAG: beta-lactamase family protein [Candidatus Latescibacteria bacterium]|jgi:CubicO group peptidase (beta-lactamase class C family)|nr:beta-lactamase family protein [Candidatus Latescibacterota bacterium]